jgi:hypothetical protein
LIPGYPQWRWRQRERSLALAGTFAASLAVAVFAWGTPIGSLMIACAFAAHVASASDAIRQGAFPGFARGVPSLSASLGLGLSCYVPGLALATVLAWPGERGGEPAERYLVNRWAYEGAEPQSGEWLYHEGSGGQGFGIGRVVAGPGQEVRWSGSRLLVGEKDLGWIPAGAEVRPKELSMTVPEGHLLVAPSPATGQPAPNCGLMLIPRERVVGRAWARIYPVWSRQILF